jgi:hypothetical protein
MSSRVAAYVVVTVGLTLAEPVCAQQINADVGAPDAAQDVEATSPTGPAGGAERPKLLVPLYASLVGLQLVDGLSTVAAVRTQRARELNPLMAPFAGNWPAMVLVKSGSAALTIYAIERLWKKNRAAAIATMVGLNVAYSVVASRNLAVLR